MKPLVQYPEKSKKKKKKTLPPTPNKKKGLFPSPKYDNGKIRALILFDILNKTDDTKHYKC